MKIQSIKKQKNGKYKLQFDNNSSMNTYDNVILNNNLLFDASIDSDKMRKINEENLYYDIYNKVLSLVTRKMRSKKEIEEYVKKFNLDTNKYNELMNNLVNNGIVNDLKFVKAYIHDRIEFSNDGPLKIKEELLKHDIDMNIIEDEISSIDESIFDDKLKKIIKKKIKSNNKYSNSLLKRKIGNELLMLGYDINGIDEYFDEDNDDDILKKEYLKLKKKYSLKYKDNELANILFQKLYIKGFNKESIRNIMDSI